MSREVFFSLKWALGWKPHMVEIPHGSGNPTPAGVLLVLSQYGINDYLMSINYTNFRVSEVMWSNHISKYITSSDSGTVLECLPGYSTPQSGWDVYMSSKKSNGESRNFIIRMQETGTWNQLSKIWSRPLASSLAMRRINSMQAAAQMMGEACLPIALCRWDAP